MDIEPDKELLMSLVRTRMPFGKYKGVLLCDLPEAYLVWFRLKGFPQNKLGVQLQAVLEIKENGVGAVLVQMKKVLNGINT